MDLVLCHTTADFDALGAAVGLCVLCPGTRIVLCGGCHPTVRDFLALHRDEYPLIERRSIDPQQIRSIAIVDAATRDRLGKVAEWLDLPHLTEIAVFDHHLQADSDIRATLTQIEAVGATTTLIVEKLREQSQSEFRLQPSEATVMALGIHVDTGSLTFEGATSRDAMALAWLMQQGASLRVIGEYVEPGLSPQLQDLLPLALNNLRSETLHGCTIASVLLTTEGFVPGLSSLAARLLDLTESDALLLGNVYSETSSLSRSTISNRLTIIGRSRVEGTNLNELFKPLGGGGHASAASLSTRDVDAPLTLEQLTEEFKAQIPHPPTARELMSSPVRTIRPETSVGEAHRILLRYGHSGLSVVDEDDRLAGIISRRDIDIALHHGFSHAPVKGYMTWQLKTITPDTLLPEIESLMVTYDIGRLPVLENGQLVGIVTRTDVLRELHQQKAREKNADRHSRNQAELSYCHQPQSIEQLLRSRISPQLWQLLSVAGNIAIERGWQLYIVGGAVRDLLLAPNDTLELTDIDLVVDGGPRAGDRGAGVNLASELQKLYPTSRLEVHGQFQTAALLWHKDSVFGSLWVDIATARTEFYPYPAANPEVEASSIRQDLYRRDFTINALAVRLSAPRSGELLDFFGGLVDLGDRQIRVLHPNSFIEDPTRIYRAVRFAVRLGFAIEPQTEAYIRHALASGIYYRIQGENGRAPALETRLKSELKYILQADYWQVALQMLGDLEALRCLHPTLELNRELWRQLQLLEHFLQGRKKKEEARRKKGEMGRGGEGERGRESYQSPMPDAQCPMPNSPFPTINIPDWQMRLEVLIAYLAPEYRGKVAANLQLPADSIKRLQELETRNNELLERLPKCESPSQLMLLLRDYDLPVLIAIALQSQRSARRQIWEYLTKWAIVEPPLNGNDLKALGYKPGPGFKRMLDDLLAARLDGNLADRADAISFLAQHYPQGK